MILGVEPQIIERGCDLSKPLRDALPAVVDQAQEMLLGRQSGRADGDLRLHISPGPAAQRP